MKTENESRHHKKWNARELNYLQSNWGHISIGSICKHLGRTKNAIMGKVQKMGLPPFLESSEYITMHQLILALGLSGDCYKLTSWVQNRGFPVHDQRRGDAVIRVVYLDEFWEWAEKNRAFVDFSKMEPLALGEEPEWLDQQRRKDYKSFAIQRKDPWTPEEDSRLKFYLKQHKYGYAELSELLQRSDGAIQRRCQDLGLKERPVKANKHGAESAWTNEHYEQLANGIRNGDSYTIIAKAVNRSEKAVRGKVYTVYLTENLDKVRSMLSSGKFGDGAPIPTVRQGRTLSRTSRGIKEDMTRLVTVLRYRMNELGYEPYWQRHMCLNWDDIKGCTAGCTDCDSCTEFRRIRPQYCVRCGGTFYERTENKMCESCRKARKKQAQRKWAALHERRKT